ncbi:MAG: fimbrillin family protein [Bacteroidales bacterium]
MKKLFLLLAIATLGLASCTDEQVLEDTQKDGISFRTMVGKNPNFKIMELTNTAFTDFWVSAYRTTGDVNLDTLQTLEPYINNLLVTKQDALLNTWGYAGAYYWPLLQKLNFFAHNAGVASTMPTTNIVGYPSFTFTQNMTAQKDLVVASARNLANLPNAVGLEFKHALCQVNFSLQGAVAGPDFVIKSIEMLGIKDNGTFKFKDTLYYNWKDQSGAVTYTYFNGNTVAKTITNSLISFGNGSGVATGAGNSAITGQEALMLIPQDGENLVVKVTYDFVNAGVVLVSNATATATLTGERMNVGKKVRYNLTIPVPTGVAGNRIEFTGTVSDWTLEVPGGVTTVL